MKQNKIKQTETREIKRSEINFAPYNPRIISEDARKRLKENLKTVGLMGGIVWNEATKNLVGGHQKIGIIDEVNKYDPDDPETDYLIRVEVTNLDETTEKEQNLFLNNKAVQGTFDDDMLRDMLAGIDYKKAGFNDFDMDILGMSTFEEPAPIEEPVQPNKESQEQKPWKKDDVTKDNADLTAVDSNTLTSEENKKIDRELNFYEDSKENQIARHNEVQKIKDRINNKNDINNDGGMLSYLVISFPNPTEKMDFVEQLGFDPMAKVIDIKDLKERIDIIDVDDDMDFDFGEDEDVDE